MISYNWTLLPPSLTPNFLDFPETVAVSVTQGAAAQQLSVTF